MRGVNGWLIGILSGILILLAGKRIQFGEGYPESMVKIENIVEPINVFIFEKLPYPLILGVPFITELRVHTMVLDDGMHMAKVTSNDTYRQLQFLTLKPWHFRDCHELRTLMELEEQNEEDFD
jgi:hypothetical protein